jgi:hypothetical protein
VSFPRHLASCWHLVDGAVEAPDGIAHAVESPVPSAGRLIGLQVFDQLGRIDDLKLIEHRGSVRVGCISRISGLNGKGRDAFPFPDYFRGVAIKRLLWYLAPKHPHLVGGSSVP